MKILLTGEPRIGKTTILENFLGLIKDKQGFVTREVRDNGERTGFKLVSSDGQTAVLASVDSNSEFRVSKYGVNIEEFERFIKNLPLVQSQNLLYIDEIGQMELLADSFKKVVTYYLNSDNHYVGTISSVYSDDFTKQILSRYDLVHIKLTYESREQVVAALEGLAENISLIQNLDAGAQDELTKMARMYVENLGFVQLKKLFKNAVKYVVEGRVSQMANCYVVKGNTKKHKVDVSDNYSCDCSLFNGKGEYTGNAGECSHIQAVKLYNASV